MRKIENDMRLDGCSISFYERNGKESGTRRYRSAKSSGEATATDSVKPVADKKMIKRRVGEERPGPGPIPELIDSEEEDPEGESDETPHGGGETRKACASVGVSGEEAVKNRIDAFGAVNDAFRFQSEIQYLTIIGSIEGHTIESPQDKTTRYENIIPQLVAVQENPAIKGLLIILNTMGGDVEAGLALAELVATLSKPTVSLVLGGGHSIGVPLATAADYSFIAESAAMTIHPVRLTGLVIGASPTYDYFRKMQDRIVNFIMRTSGADKEKILSLMNATDRMANDVGTILFGKEAVEAGIINEVGGLSRALEKLRELIGEQELGRIRR